MNETQWQLIQKEAEVAASNEPFLIEMLTEVILSRSDFAQALSILLSEKLHCSSTSTVKLHCIIDEALADPAIAEHAEKDLAAVVDRDSACDSYLTPLLYFKGYQALQSYRIAHWLWQRNREPLALYLQHRISVQFGVDIHPAAKIGSGIMMDHATGIVIGETCVIGDNVSIMQEVTLGGTGKEHGDRHPKVADGVLISSGAKILGNIHLGEGCKIGAGSVVLQDIPPHTTAAGVPARIIGKPKVEQPALEMNHEFNTDSDYSI